MRFTHLLFKKNASFFFFCWRCIIMTVCQDVFVWIFPLQVLAVNYALYIPSYIPDYIKASYVEKLGMMQRRGCVSGCKSLSCPPLLSDLFGKSISDAPIMRVHFGDVIFLIIYSIPLLFWLCLVHINTVRALCCTVIIWTHCCF